MTKLELYQRLRAELEPQLAVLGARSPERMGGDDEVEGSQAELESEPGASEQWSPAQAEIYRIAGEIAEYCLSPEAAVSAAIIARPELYAAHDRWIKERVQEGF